METWAQTMTFRMGHSRATPVPSPPLLSVGVVPGKCGDVSFDMAVECYLGFAVTVKGRLVGQPADNLADSGVYRGAALVQRALKHICLHRIGANTSASRPLDSGMTGSVPRA